MWIYKTMTYDNRLVIQFRFDYVTGVVEMKVDDAVADNRQEYAEDASAGMDSD